MENTLEFVEQIIKREWKALNDGQEIPEEKLSEIRDAIVWGDKPKPHRKIHE